MEDNIKILKSKIISYQIVLLLINLVGGGHMKYLTIVSYLLMAIAYLTLAIATLN